MGAAVSKPRFVYTESISFPDFKRKTTGLKMRIGIRTTLKKQQIPLITKYFSKITI